MESPVRLRSAEEVAGIRQACGAAAGILRHLEPMIAPGVTTAALDRAAGALMRSLGARAAVAVGFPGSICVSVNEVAAHGVPGDRRLAVGDLVSVDVSVVLGGWCGDAACSYAVGDLEGERLRVWAAARSALAAAIAVVRAGRRLGDIGAAVLSEASRHGCVVISELVGHGIGRELHEEPQVFHTGLAGEGPRILPGMVLTVEPALSSGSGRITTAADGWSLRAADGAAVAQFEHTLAVFPTHTEVLTRLEP